MIQIVRNDKLYFRWILAISIFIPVAVMALLYLPVSENIRKNVNVDFLPKLNAIINSLVSILLVIGYLLVKNRKLEQHRMAMISAFFLSALFLISYIVYHTLNVEGETKYTGEGIMRPIYFFILITHIILAAVIVPMVLFTMYRSMTGQFEKHKKLARITFPLWLYVSITGVVVYVMLYM